MACERWNDDWVARLYDELDPAEARVADAHLATCDDCRRTLERLGATRRLLAGCDIPAPHAPRLVVLKSHRLRPVVGSFVAGAACALLAFWIGVSVSPRPGPDANDDRSPAHDGSTASGGAGLVQVSAEIDRLRDLQAAVERRVSSLEGRPEPAIAEQLRRLEHRVAAERERDLEAVVQSMTAAERRTGHWISETRDALQVLALRQDPRFHER